jgi:hypothetical protein
MNVHIPEERLQKYAAGELTGEGLAGIERHLVVCEACRAEADALLELLGKLAALRAPIDPSRDLRPDIWATIDREAAVQGGDVLDFQPRLAQRTLYSVRGWLAAAAVLLILLSGTATWLLTKRGGPAATGIVPVANADYRQIEARYVLATNELEQYLGEQRAALSPETVRLIEENLRVIDRALSEAKQALETDPANPDLSRMLFATYEKKLGLLRSATQSQTGI